MLALQTSQTGVPVLPPQISTGLCHGLVTLGEQPPEGSCPYCYASVARAQEEKTGSKIKYICYRCKKVLTTKAREVPSIAVEKKEEKSPPLKLEVNEHTGEKRSKKKRKKELNAGLTLPPPKKPAVAQSLSNTVLVKNSKSSSQLAESSKSKNKLKFLMGKADPPKRGGLQDFLKRL